MQFGGVYVCTFQPKIFTGCSSDGVNGAHVIHVAAFSQRHTGCCIFTTSYMLLHFHYKSLFSVLISF